MKQPWDDLPDAPTATMAPAKQPWDDLPDAPAATDAPATPVPVKQPWDDLPDAPMAPTPVKQPWDELPDAPMAVSAPTRQPWDDLPDAPATSKPVLKSPGIMGDVARSATSAGGMLAEKGAQIVQGLEDTAQGIIGLPRTIRDKAFTYLWQVFPGQMQKFQESRSQRAPKALEESKPAQIKAQGEQIVNDFMDAVKETHQEALNEIHKQGGIPAYVAQRIAEGAGSLAIDLALLHKVSGAQPAELTGTRDLMREAALQNAKVSAAVYASTPGTPEEKLKSAINTATYMGVPTAASQLTRTWMAKTAAVLANAGLNTENYIKGLQEAHNQAVQNGNPEDWPVYAVATMGMQAMQDLMFGILTRSNPAYSKSQRIEAEKFAENFTQEWRAKQGAIEAAETARQKDLTQRALHGDKAAQAELAKTQGVESFTGRTRGTSANPEAAAEEARRGQEPVFPAETAPAPATHEQRLASIGYTPEDVKATMALFRQRGMSAGEIEDAVKDAEYADQQARVHREAERQKTSQTAQAARTDEEIKRREIAARGVVAPQEGMPSTTMLADTAKYPTMEVPVKDLKLSKDVPQFKEDADATGVVKGEALQGKPERLGTAPIVVWQRNNGDLEVITGRHRLDLWKRSKEETIPAQVVKEANGFTPQMALTFDAESNIRDGNGKVGDYAHYFRNAKWLTEAEARQRGLLSRVKGLTGWILGKNASDDVYSLYRSGRFTTAGGQVEGKLSEDKAVAIAGSAPSNPEIQRVGILYALSEQKPAADEIRNFLQAFQTQPAANRAKQLDLFGINNAAIRESIDMGKAAQKIQRGLLNELSVLRAGRKAANFAEIAKRYGIEVGDAEGLASHTARLQGELEQWQHWATDPAKFRLVRQKAGLPVAEPAAQDKANLVRAAQENQRKAEPYQRELNAGLERIQHGMGLAGWKGNIKKVESVVEKVTRKQPKNPEYNIGSLKDHVRGTLLLNDFTEAPAAIEQIAKTFAVSGGETSLNEPLNKFGYRGIHVGIKFSDGINGEIQIHTTDSWKVKEITDLIYRRWRNWTDKNIADAGKDVRSAYLRDLAESQTAWGDFASKLASPVKAAARSAVMGLESVIVPNVPLKPTQARLEGSHSLALSPTAMGPESRIVPSSAIENRVKSGITQPLVKENTVNGEDVKPLNAGNEVREDTAPYSLEQELFGRGSYSGKSALRQKLEWLAESKSGQARADKRILIQRDVQNKAKALLDALDAKRIDEAEAGRRLQISEDQAIKALEKVEREGQRRAAAPGGEQQDFLVDKPAIKDMLFETQLEFNYEYPQRPGEDKAANAEQAIKAITEIQGRDNLRLRTRQIYPGSTDDRGYLPPSTLRRGGKVILNIIGRGLAYNLSKTAHTLLVGQRLDTAAGIQELVKTARNARLETWRFLIVKDGVVIFDLPYSSRLPGCVALPRATQEITDTVEMLTKEFNADAIDYHNHPNAHTQMSDQDLLYHTKLAQEIGSRYKGSMIGNHGEYTFKATQSGYPATVVDNKIKAQADQLKTPDISHPALGQKLSMPIDVWNTAKQYRSGGSENKIMLIGRAYDKVQGVAEVDQVMLDEPVRAQALIRLFARNTGTEDVFVAGISKATYAQYQTLLEDAVRQGVVRDVVLDDGTSLVSDLHITQTDPLKGRTFGMPRHTVRLAEPGADYGDKDKSKMRGFAERAAGMEEMPPDQAAAIRANPENRYKPQSLDEIKQRVAAMSDTELADARDKLLAVLPTDGKENIGVLAGVELLNRRMARGEDVQTEVDRLSHGGTPLGQLIRQFAEVKSSTPWGFLAIIERQLTEFNRHLTPNQRARLIDLSQEDITARQILRAAERMAETDFTDANVAAVDALREKADKANRDMIKMVRDVMPQKIANMLITALQGNLLTPMSQVANITGNLLFVPLQDASQAIAAAMDGLHSLVIRSPRTVLSPTVGTIAMFKGSGRGIAQASRQLVSGVPSGAIAGENIRGFRPVRAAVQAITGDDMSVGPNGRIAKLDRFKKGLEAILGAAPEPMLRLLSFGDMPFSEGRKAKALIEQGRLRGLEGTELEKFIRFPDAEAITLVDKQARTIVFQQENRLASWLYQGLNAIPKDGVLGPTIEVTLRTFAPYLKTPINLTWQALQFHPAIALTQVYRHAKRGDRRGAYMSMGYFVVGSMMALAANYLLKHNLMSGDVSRNPKVRDLQYAVRPPNRVNLSALRRHLAGEENDPTWREEDILFSYTKLGFTGIVFNIWANHKDAMDRYALKHGPIQSKVVSMLLSQGFMISETGAAMLNMASLKGTANLLDSIANKTYDQFLPAWFQAVTAIPILNSYSAFDRTKQVYLPDLKGDGTLENNAFVNAVRAKVGMTDNLPLRRDLLGRPIPRTPYGAVSWLYQLVDVTKMQKIAKDPMMKEIYTVYTATGDAAAIPSIPDDVLIHAGNQYELTRSKYERLSELIGNARQKRLQYLMNNRSYNAMPAPAKLQQLEKAWREGSEVGKNQFISELKGRPALGTPPPFRAGKI